MTFLFLGVIWIREKIVVLIISKSDGVPFYMGYSYEFGIFNIQNWMPENELPLNKMI
jgi:hypothetical protein